MNALFTIQSFKISTGLSQRLSSQAGSLSLPRSISQHAHANRSAARDPENMCMNETAVCEGRLGLALVCRHNKGFGKPHSFRSVINPGAIPPTTKTILR